MTLVLGNLITKIKNGGTYKIQSWIDWELVSDATNPNKLLFNYSAGLRTPMNAVTLGASPTYPKVTVKDNGSKVNSGQKLFKRSGSTAPASITYCTGTIEYERGETNVTHTIESIGTFGSSSVFSGMSTTATVEVSIPKLDEIAVETNIMRTDVYSLAERLTLAINAPASGVINSIDFVCTPQREGMPTGWMVDGLEVDFPYEYSAGTTIMTRSVPTAPWLEQTLETTVNYSNGRTAKATSTLPKAKNLTWTATATVRDVLPDINANGKANIKVYANTGEADVELVNPLGWDITKLNGAWSVTVTLSEAQLNDIGFSGSARLKIKYGKTASTETEQYKAIFRTTRNINYSTGLANSVFVGGCDMPDYSSRVWYSRVNDPLYFPDTNYIEVGSNDKKVMGLVKVGEYLGIIKQGTTTETSVFLAYPTSFDNDTAYAVKQGVNGIGAVSKYCFNVLGDETLFLSEDGVRAIVASEDDERKVQDRSYFVNKRLIAEKNLEKAVSTVWNGFYLVAVNGHCYVLDGNQRNSWGNDRKNLVYECYYWDNIPAKSFAKYGDKLAFIDGESLCMFKDDDEETSPYSDDTGAVVAEWSTILDDDNAIHYFKNMQKKGCVVSLLPIEDTSAQVYVRIDNAPPILIGEVVSTQSNTPTEFYLRKKFKKYKRLQFIIRNEEPQGFGVDSIVKQYTIGNYSKNRG